MTPSLQGHHLSDHRPGGGEDATWTSRPLERIHAAVVLDAINVKVRGRPSRQPARLCRDRGRPGGPKGHLGHVVRRRRQRVGKVLDGGAAFALTRRHGPDRRDAELGEADRLRDDSAERGRGTAPAAGGASARLSRARSLALGDHPRFNPTAAHGVCEVRQKVSRWDVENCWTAGPRHLPFRRPIFRAPRS